MVKQVGVTGRAGWTATKHCPFWKRLSVCMCGHVTGGPVCSRKWPLGILQSEVLRPPLSREQGWLSLIRRLIIEE